MEQMKIVEVNLDYKERYETLLDDYDKALEDKLKVSEELERVKRQIMLMCDNIGIEEK